jgi:hypothetical protein
MRDITITDLDALGAARLKNILFAQNIGIALGCSAGNTIFRLWTPGSAAGHARPGHFAAGAPPICLKSESTASLPPVWARRACIRQTESDGASAKFAGETTRQPDLAYQMHILLQPLVAGAPLGGPYFPSSTDEGSDDKV